MHGDVKVFPTCDDPARFRVLKKVYIDQIRGQVVPADVSDVRMDGRFVVLHLSGWNSPEEARILRGRKLLIDREDAMPLPEGRYYIPDLIGLRVITEEDAELGIFTDVLRTGANDVYVVKTPEGRELLIPAIAECILETRPEEGFMRVHLLPGLEDL